MKNYRLLLIPVVLLLSLFQLKGQQVDTISYPIDNATGFTINSTLGGGYASGSNEFTSEVGQVFNHTGGYLQSVMMWIGEIDTIGTPDNFEFNVYNVMNGLPVGNPLATEIVSASALTAGNTFNDGLNLISFAQEPYVSCDFAVTVNVDLSSKDDTIAIVANQEPDGLEMRRSIVKLSPQHGGNWAFMDSLWGANWNRDLIILPILQDSASALANVQIQIDSVTIPSCGTCDGAVWVSPQGNNPPYQYFWSNGSTDSILTGVCPGIYQVTVTNANFCSAVNDSVFVNGNPSCFDTISGKVFIDLNGNCIQEFGEESAPNTMIKINPGGAVFTNQNGEFIFVTEPGAYNVSAILPHSYINLSCPASGEYNLNFSSVGLVSDTNDFALEIIPIQDLSTSIFCGVARPGFQQNLSFTISNDGTIPSNGVAAFQLDSLLTFLNSTGSTSAPDSIDANSNTIYWSFDTLNMFETITFTFRVQIPPPPILNFGDSISHNVSVNLFEEDVTLENNTSICNTMVTGAYDPNDKAVTPSGVGPEGNITEDDTLIHYRIRFQNTGNDTAFTVVIRDTLDTDLDWSSFKKGTSSHPYEVKFEEDDILVFTFNNILLPDSNVNEPASHGHVTFYIEHNGVLPLGTEIENRAAIYFDFNLPIITNTVMNKIYKPVGIEEVSKLNINLYPNPTENQVIIDAGKENINRVIITDISGKQLMDVQSLDTQKHQLNLDLESGIYLVQVYTNKGVAAKKMMVK